MSGDIKENVTRRSIWLRLCFMIILSMAFGIAEVVISAVVAFQFLSSLFTGQSNDQLTRFGRNLARYIQQITIYLTFASEEIPFPFMAWPDEPHDAAPVDEDSNPLNDEPETAGDSTEDDAADDAPVAEAPAEQEINQPDHKPETAGDPTKDDAAGDENMAEAPAEQEINQPDHKPETAGDPTKDDAAGDENMAEAPAEQEINQPDHKPETAGDDTEPVSAGDTKSAKAPQTAIFADSNAYERFMGERSRLGGERFVRLLGMPSHLSWLDVGCGTGAFSAVIMEKCEPAMLIGIDRSEVQITHAQNELGSAYASFRLGDATALPFEADSFDVAVSSYVLNFVPDKQKMMDEMARVVRPEGTVAVSVFDHAGGRMTTHPFWELVKQRAAAFHKAEFERRGWTTTHPEALSAFFETAGLEDVSVDTFEIDETFSDFDDYWNSLTGSLQTSGINLYINALDQEELEKFRDELKSSLAPPQPDGSIKLIAGSWVVRGKVPA